MPDYESYLYRISIVILSFSAATFLLTLLTTSVTADEKSAEIVSILETTPNSITIAFNGSGWSLNTIEENGEQWSRIAIPGAVILDQPGAPQLPLAGALLGVPDTEQLTLEVLSTQHQAVNLSFPFQTTPAVEIPRLLGDSIDTTAEPSPPFTPATTIAEIAQRGMLRDQPFVQVQFHPVTLKENGLAATVYDEIVVRLSWSTTRSGDFRPNHPQYEQFIESTLLNYNSLQRPAPITSTTKPAPTRATNPAALKLTINQTGLYQLTYHDLLTAGWAPDSRNPANFHLRQRDASVAILVDDGSDGTFDPGDRILFYAEEYEDLYTNQNIYWLYEEDDPGLRIQPVDATPRPTAAPAHFAASVHLEQDTSYWRSMANGSGQDHWFWQYRFGPATAGLDVTRSVIIDLANIATTPLSATLRVHLKGYTALDHKSRLVLNGNLLNDMAWHGQLTVTQAVTFPQALLIDGENTLEIVALDAGAVVDQYYLNWVELDYFDRFVAEEDVLMFDIDSAETITISNLTTRTLFLLDTSNPTQPIQLFNATLSPISDTYSLSFSPPETTTTALVVSENALLTPEAVTVDAPSTLRTPTNGADYIVISHSNFITDAQRLANHRQADGYRTAVVDVQDIYDEFNGGLFSPEPIRDFLDYARLNWVTPAPSYVVLLGDGYMDYKDYLSSGTGNYVPPALYETSAFGQVPADSYFVRLAGDDALPEMFIGRLSADSPQQSAAIVDKIIGYDSQPLSTAGTAIFVSDDESAFEENSEEIVSEFSAEWTINRIYTSKYPPGDPTNTITASINAGAQFINYTGHGEYYRWGRWNDENSFIFEVNDIESLSNAPILPIVTIGNCLNGFFSSYHNRQSMAEHLQREPDGGAIAVWASANLGFTSGHRQLMTNYYDQQLKPTPSTIGAASTNAATIALSTSAYWQEMVETYILFGDPATVPNTTSTTPTGVTINTRGAETPPHPTATLLSCLLLLLLYSTHFLRQRFLDTPSQITKKHLHKAVSQGNRV